jgi:hypothetical protein
VSLPKALSLLMTKGLRDSLCLPKTPSSLTIEDLRDSRLEGVSARQQSFPLPARAPKPESSPAGPVQGLDLLLEVSMEAPR